MALKHGRGDGMRHAWDGMGAREMCGMRRATDGQGGLVRVVAHRVLICCMMCHGAEDGRVRPSSSGANTWGTSEVLELEMHVAARIDARRCWRAGMDMCEMNWRVHWIGWCDKTIRAGVDATA